jgi:hypothetical protein
MTINALIGDNYAAVKEMAYEGGLRAINDLDEYDARLEREG